MYAQCFFDFLTGLRCSFVIGTILESLMKIFKKTKTIILFFFLLCTREYRNKDNVTMGENDTTVSAYNTKSFVFMREKSVGDPAMDSITTVNIPAWVSHELKVLDK